MYSRASREIFDIEFISYKTAKLNSLKACEAHLAATGNLAEFAQFSSPSGEFS